MYLYFLYGGGSVESGISQQSAEGIMENIDQAKFSATMQNQLHFTATKHSLKKY